MPRSESFWVPVLLSCPESSPDTEVDVLVLSCLGDNVAVTLRFEVGFVMGSMRLYFNVGIDHRGMS